MRNLEGLGTTGADGSLLGMRTYGVPTLGPRYVSGPLQNNRTAFVMIRKVVAQIKTRRLPYVRNLRPLACKQLSGLLRLLLGTSPPANYFSGRHQCRVHKRRTTKRPIRAPGSHLHVVSALSKVDRPTHLLSTVKATVVNQPLSIDEKMRSAPESTRQLQKLLTN